MTPGLTSIVIPAFNHAQYLRDAIESALAQTAPVEVIVVDDGSTDGTFDLLRDYEARDVPGFGFMRIDHRGVAAARNAGIERASGEFIMFLDADDVIEDTKVELQLTRMDDDAGWVLCDVRIEDVSGRTQLASERYGYAQRKLDGWIQPELGVANFIPVHSPLLRRAILGASIRFPLDKSPEDWHFWYAVAGVARCRYLPAILASYRKRRDGRNTTTPKRDQTRPGTDGALRLNLGCGTPDALSWHPMPGMVNLDKSLGWRFEDGLHDFADGSVSGITVSHSLMYVQLHEWSAVFAEFARVLRPGGVVRITEDDATNPASARFGGWRGSESAVTLTDARMTRHYLETAGFTVHDVNADASYYADESLRQKQHGDPPNVYWIEGVREQAVLFSPHADDEALYCSWTIIRHKPRVIICCPSAGDYGDTETRAAESREAVAILGGGPVEQWDGAELESKMRALDAKIRPSRVWAPSVDTSHPDHLAVARAAAAVFGDRLTRYQTYDQAGKVRAGEPVAFEQSWTGLKRRALACYRTQLAHPRAGAFFADDLAEYQA